MNNFNDSDDDNLPLTENEYPSGNGYHSHGGGDKIKEVQSEIDQVQMVVRQSISKAIDRGDKLNDLSDKAEDLQVQAGMFKKHARKTRIHFCIQKWKMIALIVFILFVLGLSLGLWSMNASNDADADVDSTATESGSGIDSATDLGNAVDNMQAPTP